MFQCQIVLQVTTHSTVTKTTFNISTPKAGSQLDRYRLQNSSTSTRATCNHRKHTENGISELLRKFLKTYYIEFRPANSTRIRESILAMIPLTFGYENQFPPLNCIQTDSVSIEFDSCKLKRICNPGIGSIKYQHRCIPFFQNNKQGKKDV